VVAKTFSIDCTAYVNQRRVVRKNGIIQQQQSIRALK